MCALYALVEATGQNNARRSGQRATDIAGLQLLKERRGVLMKDRLVYSASARACASFS